MKRTGGQLIVDVLRKQGVNRIFGVPGESFLAVLDALVDAPEMEYVVAKHEGGASMMADADGKLTGRPGIVMVTRGPGAANAYAGIHVAYQDSTPLIMLVGLIGRDDTEREAFQEFDLKAIFGTQTKWVATINDAARIPELLSRAFATAMAGRPGPVVIGLPEDMLRDVVEAPALPEKVEPVQAAPSPQAVEQLTALLASAKRPLVIAGGETWTEEARQDLAAFAANWSLPVACSFRCQDRMSANNPAYVGDAGLGINPKLAQRIKDADVLIVLGARLGDCTTSGYTLVNIPVPQQKLVHIHPSASEIGSVYAPALGICSGMAAATAALAKTRHSAEPTWKAWSLEAREDYLNWSTPTPGIGDVNLAAVMEHLNEVLPENAILTNGAGNYTVWLHRFYKYRGFRSQVAPTSGSMGYGLPAAIAAKLRHPDRPAICFAGDGCLQMTIQELGTARQYGAGIITILCNNGIYGTIRMHQERNYPARVMATDIVNPDFIGIAQAYGFDAVRVTKTSDFAPAFDAMLAGGKGGFIEVVMTAEDLTPRQTLSQMRAAAQAAKS